MEKNGILNKILTLSILFFLFFPGRSMAAEIIWTLNTGSPVYSSPTYYNGDIYIGSDDHNLYCIEAQTGKVRWKFATQGLVRCQPAVEKGIVYFESDDGNLYAVGTKSGKELWSYNIGNNIQRVLPNTVFTGNYWDYMQSSPCVDQGVVFAGSGDSCLYAIRADNGKLQWKFRTGGIIRSSPTVSRGLVYFGSWDGYIYALNEKNGALVWKFDTRGKQYQNVQSSPKIAQGILYCGSRNPWFYALNDRTGKEIWKYSYQFSWVESSAVIHDGIVYIGSSDLREVFAFDAKTGKVIWKLKINGTAWSTPYYYEGFLYIGQANYKDDPSASEAGGLLAINAATGRLAWEIPCGSTPSIGGIVSSPLVHDGIVFYGSLDGKVYAVGIDKN